MPSRFHEPNKGHCVTRCNGLWSLGGSVHHIGRTLLIWLGAFIRCIPQCFLLSFARFDASARTSVPCSAFCYRTSRSVCRNSAVAAYTAQSRIVFTICSITSEPTLGRS